MLVIEGLEDRKLLAVAITGSYSQNFDTLASSGTAQSTLPAGWELSESGTNANATYDTDTGSSTTGNTYSYGSAASTDRAFGGLQSGSLIPTIGAGFTNNGSTPIISVAIGYTGEQWRLGAAGRQDRIDFQYSTNATSVGDGTATWTDVNTLDFSSPVTLSVGAKDGNLAANRTVISAVSFSVTVNVGSNLFIRWTDFNATGADDGLAVDDFTLVPTFATVPVVTSPSNASITYGANTSFTASATGNPTPTVQWQTFVGGSWTNITASTDGGIYTNFTSNTLNVTKPPVSLSSRTYRAAYTNVASTVNSSSASLTVAPISLTVAGTAANKVYDGSTTAVVSASVTSTGSVLSGDVVGVTASGTFDNKNAGNGKTVNLSGYTLTGAAAGNYSIGSSNATTTADITKKSVAVTGTANSKTYDGTTSAVASATVLASDVISGDDVTATVTGAFLDKNAANGKTVNLSGFTLGGTSVGNYQLGTTNATTTADISKLAVTVSAVTAKKTFDGTTTAPGVPSVSPALATGDSSGFSQSFDTAAVGTGKTLTPSGLAVDGNGGNNYSYTYQTSSTGEITPIALATGAVNGGVAFLNPAQRSQIVAVSVNFNVPVTLSAGAFNIKNLDTNTSLDGAQIIVTPSSGAATSFTITFGAGTGVISRSGGTTISATSNSLADGNYQLTVDKTKVLDGNGTAMAADYLFGNAFNQNFFRLFGDSDGDGDVDATDNNNFRRAQTIYNAALDYNGNSAVDATDATQFRSNLNKRRRSF